MNNIWKRSLSLFLALVMVFGMVPVNAFATETEAVEQAEAPATEAPIVTEAPVVTEAPTTEAPATEAPSTEAPATEAPATEAPATEAPATEAPKSTEAPTEAPKATEAEAVVTFDLESSAEAAYSDGTYSIANGKLRILAGSISKGQLHSIAGGDWKTVCGYSTDGGQTYEDVTYGNSYSEVDLTSYHNQTITFATKKRSWNGKEFTTTYEKKFSYTIEVYYIITADVTNEDVPGSGVNVTIGENTTLLADGATMEVIRDTAVSVEGKPVDGYTISSQPTINSPVQASQTVYVTYKDLVNYKVTVTEDDAEGGVVVIGEGEEETKSAEIGEGKDAKITITPAAGDGYAYYVESITVNGVGAEYTTDDDGVVTLTIEKVEKDTAVAVTYGKKTIEADGEMKAAVNGYSASTKAEDLKEALLDAILGEGTYEADDYAVYLKSSITIQGHEFLEHYWNVEGDSVKIFVDVPVSAETIAAGLDVDATEDIRVVKLAADGKPEVTGDYEVSIKDSRYIVTITIDSTKLEIEAKENPGNIDALIKAAVTATYDDPTTAEVETTAYTGDISIDCVWTWPEGGDDTKTYPITASVDASTVYQGAEATGTLSLTDTTVLYDVIYMVEGAEWKKDSIAENTTATNYDAPEGYGYDVENGVFNWVTEDGEVYDFSTAVTGDITLIAKYAPYIAQVDEKKYTDLKEALLACTNGETVKLIADITYTADDVVYAHGGATGFGKYDQYNPSIIYIGGTKGATDAENQPSNVNAVLDLNGHTITNEADAYLFLLMDNCKVTFKDSVGTGELIAKNYALIWVTGAETLVTIESGKYTTASAGGVLHSTHSGDLVINGGEFRTNAKDASLLIVLNTEVFNNPNYFLSGTATITVYGGTFHGFNPEKTYDAKTDTYNNVVAEDYEAVEKTTDVWTVQPKQPCDVKFVVKGENGEETTFKTVTVVKGKPVSEPTEVPTKDGYGFICWTTEDGEEYDFSAAVETAITLYAKFLPHVAYISDTYYVSLVDAFDAAVDDDTIVLIADVEVDGSDVTSVPAATNGNGAYFSPGIFNVVGNKAVTFNLNGNNITYRGHAVVTKPDGSTVSSCSIAHGLFFVNAGADLTIVGEGNVTVYGMASGVYPCSPDSTVTVKGGNWYNYGCETCHGTNLFLYASHGGELYIKGGYFEQALDSDDNSYLLVENGGSAANAVIDYSKTKIEVSGGTFVNMDPENAVYIDQQDWSTQKFGKTDVTADGYKSYALGDNKWTVVPESYITVTVSDNSEEGTGTTTVTGNKTTYTNMYNGEVTIKAAPSVVDGNSVSYVSSIKVNNVEQTLTYADDYSVTIKVSEDADVVITYTACGFVYDEDGEMRYYYGINTPDYETLYEAVITDPAYGENVKTVKYLARPAGTYTFNIPVLFEYDLPSWVNKLGLDDIKIGGTESSTDLDEAWLVVGESFKTLTEEELQAQYDTEIEALKAKIAAIDVSNVKLTDYDSIKALWNQFSAISEELNTLIETIKNEAQYLGYHQFGAISDDAVVDEDGNVREILWIVYEDESKHLEDDNVIITLVDDRIPTTLTGGDLTFEYDEYTNEDLLAAITLTDNEGNVLTGLVDQNGNPVAPYMLSDMSGKNVQDDAYTYNVYFAGNYNYKPTEATFNLTVIKAPSNTDVPNVNVTYGTAYDASPVITNKHGSEIDIESFRFYVGLNISELDVDGDGIHGLAGEVHLMLPESLQSILNVVGLEDGMTRSLSDLLDTLTSASNLGLLEEWGITSDVVDTLNEALTAINDVVEAGEMEITIGGGYPTDSGAYLHGAVTVDGNYETSYDVGYIIIKPNAEQVYLDWNYSDSNAIYTKELLQFIDLGASAYNDKAFTSLVEDAQVNTLFLGVDEEGNFIYTLSEDELGLGAYTEIAFIAEFGNEFYYAVPIVRAFVIAPNLVDVEIVDAEGAKDVFTYEFNNQAPALDVELTYNGTVTDLDREDLTVTYTGIRSNTNTYNSTEIPTHAGVYLVTAVYVDKDENGELIAAGADAATLIITPTESTITVDSKIVTVDENKSYDLQKELVTVGSTVDGLKPDTTIISAQINTNGTFSEEGWAAVQGNVNVDFPSWVEEILAEHAPDVMTSGITVGTLKEKLSSRVDIYADELAALGATEEIVNSFTNLIGTVVNVLDEIPDDITVTFDDDVSVQNVGAYAVIGIVTDSDHYPAVDAGVLVITPDVKQVELKWNYEDENNIWTRELLTYVDLYASAYDENGELDEEATAKITHQFIGFDKEGNLIVTNDASELPNGVYTELAYIELEIDGNMTISDMIAREIVIVPGTATVEFVDAYGNVNNDRHFTFDNTPKAMDVRVSINGTVITPAEGTLTVTYIGVQTNTQTYNSPTAPTHAGVYTVVAEYRDYADNGSTAHIGAAVGAMVIEPAESSIEVTGGTVTYDGKGHTATVTATGAGVTSPDYTLISGGVYVTGDIDKIGVDAFHGNVNIDFPAWLDEALAEYEFKTEGIDTADLVKFIGSYREDLIDLIPADELGISVEDVTATIDELLAVLAKLPEDVTLTFNDGVTYTEPGYYFYYGIVTDSDFYPSTDTGLLVIEKKDALFGAWHTVVPYDGKEHTVYVPNDEFNFEEAPTMDYITMIVNREDNTVNIITDEDLDYVWTTVERILNIELPTEISIADLRAKLGEYGLTVEDFANVVINVIDALLSDMEMPTDPQEYAESTYRDLVNIKEVLADLPETGTITFNGALPVDVGAYEFFIFGWSEHYKSVDASAVLFIEPIRVVVDDNANSKYYGETDPELTAAVRYYSIEGREEPYNWEGNTDGLYAKDYTGYNDGTFNRIVYGEVEITELPDDIELTYTVTRDQAGTEEGENVGEYELHINGTIVDSKNYVLEIVEDDVFTILPAEVTVVVNDASKTYGEDDPAIDYTFTVNKGVVTEDEIGLKITRVEGENVGEYDYIVNYTESDNWTVTVEKIGALTIEPAKITSVAVEGEYIYNGSEQTAKVVVKSGDKVLTEGVDYTVTGHKQTNAGDYTVTVEAKGNYVIDNETKTLTDDWTIAKAKITVTMDKVSKVYGQEDPNFTYTYETDFEGEFMLVVPQTRAEGENVGTYEIKPEAYVFFNDNFDVEVVAGTLTITKAKVTITVKDKTVVAGTATPEMVKGTDYTVENTEGVVSDEELNLTIAWSPELTAAGTLKHGEYGYNINYTDPTTDPDNWDVVVVDANGKLIVELGDYVCWNMQTGVYYNDLSYALDDVDGCDEWGDSTEDELSVETIQMLKDYKEQYVIIAPGTTLDLADHTVTAKYVVGMKDSYLTGDIEVAKLIVDPDKIELGEDCYVDSLGYDILPIYNPDGYFQFSRFQVSTTGYNRGLKVTEDEIYFRFVVNTSGFAFNDLLPDGASDNELSFVVRLEWENASGTGTAYQNFVYKDDHVGNTFTNSNDLYLSLTGYEALDIDLSTLTVKGMVITNSGVVSECIPLKN